MKKIILIFTLALSYVSYSQECKVDTFIINNCSKTALHLSMFDMRNNLLLKDSVYVPDSIPNKYLQILSSIYNLHTSTSDSIFHTHKIFRVEPDFEKGYCYGEPYISLSADTNYIWVKKLLKDSAVSDNKIVDSLFTKYQYTLESIYIQSYGKDSLAHFTFKSDSFINIFPILKILENVEGIKYAHPAQRFFGDNPGITVSQTDSSHLITFRRGWMGCPAGCVYNEYWYYEVIGCEARELKNSALNLSDNKVNTISIFPNPAKNLITIRNLEKDIKIKILSLEGQTILSSFTVNNTLDLSNLHSGVYILSFELNGKKEIRKIIKR